MSTGQGSGPSTVVVTGAAGRVGRRVLAALAEADDVERVVALDRRPVVPLYGKVTHVRTELPGATSPPELEGADTLIHLAFAAADRSRRRAHHANVEGARQLLAVPGLEHAVVVSSAMVYGAWPNNPVPITEEAPLRPEPDLNYAVQKAEVEQLVEEWRVGQPGRTATVLRPCTTLDQAGGGDWLSRAIAAGAGVLSPRDDPPMQFLALDDLVSAVEVARRQRLDAVCNVAPDGSIDGARLRRLTGSRPPVRLPEHSLHWLTTVRWRFQLGPIPPGLLPYLSHPWVVANDRMRAAGWQPTVTNEQAFVNGTEARWWQVLSPQRRQELALGGAGLAAAGVAAGATAAVRHGLARRVGG